MHKEILSNSQLEVLQVIKSFNDSFGLVGGTAIALQLGHRKSIDFDLFTNTSFGNGTIVNKILRQATIESTIVDQTDELTVIVKDVKLTFLYYPFPLDFKESFEDVIKMPDLLTLAAMKVYALGRRSKWKDYVDVYFILKQFTLSDICNRAKEIFKDAFNEKLLREQLCYFNDLDFRESINFTPNNEVSDEVIKKSLIETATSKTPLE